MSIDKYPSFPQRNLSGVFLSYIFSLSLETLFQFYSFFKSGEGWSFQVCCVENDAILEGDESTW